MAATAEPTDRKNVSIKAETWERLRRHGEFGESFDDLLNRILDERENKRR